MAWRIAARSAVVRDTTSGAAGSGERYGAGGGAFRLGAAALGARDARGFALEAYERQLAQ